MTQSFSLNKNNDIFIDNIGNLSISSGIIAVTFACQNAAQTILGEMVLSVDEGLPNFQTIWIGVANIPQFEAALRVTLLAVVDVVEILSLSIVNSNNVLNYEVKILTTYGTTAIQGAV